MRKSVLFCTLFVLVLLTCSCSVLVGVPYVESEAPENEFIEDALPKTEETQLPGENVEFSEIEEFDKVRNIPFRAEYIPLHGEEYATLRLPRRADEVGFVETLMEVAFGEPEEAEDKYGVTKYGTYFGNPTYEWCTEFALWCVIQAEKLVDGQYIDIYYPYEDWSGGCISWYKKQDLFFKRDSGYVPRRGDMMFFDYDADGTADHTGLVTGVEYDAAEEKFYVLTIEGNLPEDYPVGKIVQRRLALDWEKIYGYGALLFCENRDVQCVIDY